MCINHNNYHAHLIKVYLFTHPNNYNYVYQTFMQLQHLNEWYEKNHQAHYEAWDCTCKVMIPKELVIKKFYPPSNYKVQFYT